jgi:phage virion morphogenesis protein
MAGTRIEINLNSAAASQALQRASDSLGDEGEALLLRDIGEYLQGSTLDRAALEVSPDGSPWAALSPRYATRKNRLRPGRAILRFDNHMLGDRFSYQVEPHAVALGTSAVQGAAMQFGRPDVNLPARPWLGLSEQDEREIVQITQDHLSAALSGASP